MSAHFDATVRSVTGPARSENQDTAYCDGRLLFVADGMGGAPAGDLASSTVALALLHAYRGATGTTPALYREAIRSGEDALDAIVRAHGELSGMGTTLTALLADADAALLLHIGDSRAYLVRGGELVQLSKDHTLVERLVHDGVLERADAFGHPSRNILMRVFDATPDLLDLRTVDLETGDRLLLCSDGLSDYVAESAIGECLARAADPEAAADALVAAALGVPTRDNVSVVVADVCGEQVRVTPGALVGALGAELFSRYGVQELPEIAALLGALEG